MQLVFLVSRNLYKNLFYHKEGLLLFGAVMKKTALASCILLLLLVSMFQFSSLATANPFISPEPSPVPYPAEPCQEFPTIRVTSPKNGEVFTATTAEINFTVAKPDSWNFYWLDDFNLRTIPVIGSYIVYVYLDEKLYSILADPRSDGFPNADYSGFLSPLDRGRHNVRINVVTSTFYDDPSPEPDDFLTYPKNISKTIQFTVNADLPTPSPSPEPTQEVEPFTTLLVAAASFIAIVVVGAGLLVYFKKYRRDKSP